MESAHNQRIKMKREKDVASFMEVTGSNKPNAQAYLQANAFDCDAAVSAFFASGGKLIAAAPSNNNEPDATSDAANDVANDVEDDNPDDISSILNNARQVSREEQAEVGKFMGRGQSLSAGNDVEDDLEPLQVRITFYADGFTAEAAKEAKKKDSNNSGSKMMNLRRRAGGAQVHTFGAAQQHELESLPLLRSYDTAENKKFIADIKKEHVPREFQRRTAAGAPIPVSIVLHDQRPKSYPEGGGQKSASAAFSGTGQTLGGERAKQRQRAKVQSLTAKAGDSAAPSLDDGVIEWVFGILFWLLSWLLALPKNLLGIGGSAGAAAPTRHTVDAEAPTTTISIRLASGARIRVQETFNLTHTIGDLRACCVYEMWREWEAAGADMRGARAEAPAPFEAPDFNLVAGFPPQVVAGSNDNDGDSATTLEEAKLLNAAIVQKIVEFDVDANSEGHEKRE